MQVRDSADVSPPPPKHAKRLTPLPPPRAADVWCRWQPINSFDWSPDKEGLCVMGSYDQSVRVAIVTKLNKV